MNRSVTYILFLLCYVGWSQSYPVRLEFHDGDSIEGYGSFSANGKIKFQLEREDPADKFDGYDIKYVEFLHRESLFFEYRLMNMKMIPLHRQVDGPMQLYVRYPMGLLNDLLHDETELEAAMSGREDANSTIMNRIETGIFLIYNTDVQQYLQKKGSEELIRMRSGFKKKVRQLFPNCPELLEYVDNREWKYEDLKNITEFYNDFCAEE